MPTSLTNFKTELRAAAIDLLWRQWTCLGAGLESPAAPDAHIIDPEALLLATTAFGRHDQRLFDEALTWLVRFGSLINVQRLKNLHQGGKLGDSCVLGAVADYVKNHGKLPKWGVLAEVGDSCVSQEPQSFFLSSRDTSAIHRGESDPDFLAHGWLRRPLRNKSLAMPPSSERLANVLLNLRALIGVSSRCEIILCLLTRPSARAAELARLTSYSPQSIQTTLGEMTLSGKVHSDEPRPEHGRGVRGMSRRYYVKTANLRFLWPADYAPRWLPWAALFALSQSVHKALETIQDETMLSIQVRRMMEEHMAALTEEGIGYKLFGYNPDMSGQLLLHSLAIDLPRMLREM
jgi:hypothetical protein